MRPLLLVIFMLGLAVAGCRAAQPPSAVSFWVFGDAAEQAAYEQLVAAFQEAHPNITVSLSTTPGQSEYRQRLATAFSNNNPPDVMLLNYRRFAQFAAEGGLEPLTPYLAESEVIAEADFYEASINAFKWDAQLWCIPQNVSSLVVYYNQDMFEAAGVPLPNDDWTWAEFVATAQALTTDPNGDGTIDTYGVGLEASLFRLAPFIWSAGGEIVDDPANPTRLTLDTPEARRALEWMVSLQTLGVAPDKIAEAGENSESRFQNGRLAMFLNSRRGTPTYREITDFTWDIAPLPRDQVAAGILHSDAFCMAARTQSKEAAWTFIEFANSEEGQTILAQSGRTVPSLRTVAESPAFLDPNAPPARSQVFLDSIPVLRAVPILPGWVQIEETAGEEIQQAYYGAITVNEAIERAQSLTAEYFAP